MKNLVQIPVSGDNFRKESSAEEADYERIIANFVKKTPPKELRKTKELETKAQKQRIQAYFQFS